MSVSECVRACVWCNILYYAIKTNRRVASSAATMPTITLCIAFYCGQAFLLLYSLQHNLAAFVYTYTCIA